MQPAQYVLAEKGRPSMIEMGVIEVKGEERVEVTQQPRPDQQGQAFDRPDEHHHAYGHQEWRIAR
jgi:hypothetical protein